MDILGTILACLVIFGLPLAAFVWFVVSLAMFIRTSKEDTKKYLRWKLSLIISSVLAGILILAIIALITTMTLAIAHM